MAKFIDTALLKQIKAFMAKSRMKPWEFGRKAANDPKLIPQLKEGRQLRHNTRRRVESFLAEQNPQERAS